MSLPLHGSERISSGEQALAVLVEELTRKLQAGEPVDVPRYVREHPEQAERLQELWPALQMLADLGRSADAGRAGSTPPVGPADNFLGTLGDYRILREIGRGGMGVVYEAEQVSLGRRVALKVLPFAATLDPKHLRRFKHEAQAAAHLHHTNIVPVFAVGCEKAVHFYAMQYIEGQSLATVIQELRRRAGLAEPAVAPAPCSASPLANAAASGDGAAAQRQTPEERPATAPDFSPLSPQVPKEMSTRLAAGISTERSTKGPTFFRTVARLGVQAAEALEHAHELGVVHRDIKPANLLVDLRGDLWVTDFGLAQFHGDAQLTITGDLLGTLRYMSPEQALAQRGVIDHRTDVYSLGATLFELLTLEAVFGGRDRQELLRQITFEEPRPPRRLNRAVPAELELVVLKALAKVPAERYATAQELADDLRRYLEDKPIRARRPTLLQRVRKWARRHTPVVWSVSLSALALLLLIVAGLSIIVVIERRALLQETQAKEKVQEALERVRRESYFQQIASAHGELLAHNPGRGEELLDACAPQAGEPDLRGWEWYYLRRMRHGGPLEFAGHGAEVRGVAFSPDGRWVASGGFDGAVRVWKAVSGKEFLVLKTGNPVFGVAFSGDGKRLAAAGMDGLVRLWDLTKRPAAPVLLRGHTGQVYAVAFSPDGQSLASGGADKIVRVWPLTPGQRVLALEGHTAPVWSVAFRPDGRRLASASFDETVRIWDTAAGQAEGVRRLVHTLTGHGEPVNCVTFSPDGRRLASAAFAPNIKLWDADTGAELQTLRGHTLVVYGVAFSPDGQRLASAGVDKTVKLWDGASGREILTLHGHTHFVNGVTFSPDGHRLASAGRDGAVRVWDATPLGETTGPELATIRGHGGLVVRLAFSPDGQRLASASCDKTVKIWDAALGVEVCTLRGHTKLVHGLAFSPDGRRLATSSWDRTVRVWDAAGRALHTLRGHNGLVDSVAFSPDGNRLASGSVDGTVRLWDAATGKPLQVFRGHTGMVIGVLFSPDGALVLSSANDGTIRVWDPATGAELPPFLGHRGPVFGLALSPDGTRLASASYDGAVKLWDAATRKELQTFRGETDTFTDVAFGPDGKFLAAANWDAVLVWNTASRQRVGRLRAHRGVVWGVAFSPDGRRLASGSGYADQGEVKLWDMTALLGMPGRAERVP